MAERDRDITFASGNGLVSYYGLTYSSFEEELPEPKVAKVDIPFGTDIDITEALGELAYSNGTHTFKMLLYGRTEQTRLNRLRLLISVLHGKMVSYGLSWDEGYTYTGRWKVEVKHLTEKADLLTLTVDRNPWKVHSQESVVLDCHPTGTYVMSGSKKYRNIKLKTTTENVVVAMTGESQKTLATIGTHTLAAEKIGNTTVHATVSDWLMYVDGTNLVVNSDKFSTSGTNAVIDSAYTVTNGNMVFSDVAKQRQTLYYTRVDL